MEEIFELIKAFNRLKEKITELIAKVDLLLKTPAALQPERDAKSCVSTDGFVDEEGACRILRLSPRTMARMRKAEIIPFFKQKRKVLYKKDDLLNYLENLRK
jgi:hypothetical protein